MEGRRLILADGTTIDNVEAGYAQGFLWLWFFGTTLADFAGVFTNSSKTTHIIFQYGDMHDVYDGFTDCRGINIDVDGRVSVCMTKGG